MYSRIMIFGKPGSGKSTFAQHLHEKTNLPLYHLDRHFYTQNWIERDYQEFMKIQHKIVSQDRWIVDGNNTKSFNLRYLRSQLCIYFNYPRRLCLWRIFKRKFAGKNPLIKDRADGCSENMRWSLIKYTWTFECRVNQHIAELRSHYPEVKFIEIRNNADLKKLYKSIT